MAFLCWTTSQNKRRLERKLFALGDGALVKVGIDKGVCHRLLNLVFRPKYLLKEFQGDCVYPVQYHAIDLISRS